MSAISLFKALIFAALAAGWRSRLPERDRHHLRARSRFRAPSRRAKQAIPTRSIDLIQAGTEAIPDSRGELVYQAWIEALPQNSRAVPLSVSPGDSVSVSITEASAGLWDVSFDDSTSGKTYETTVRYDSSLSSADWIEEMPVEIGGVIRLDEFGEINFTDGYAIKDGQVVSIGASGAKTLTMG